MNQYMFRSDSLEIGFPGADSDEAVDALVRLLHPDTYYRGRGTVTLVSHDVPTIFQIEEC